MFESTPGVMMPSMSLRRWVIALVTAAVFFAGGPSGPGTAQAPGGFAAQVAALSEPGGYFDTDNLISNERSYLQVVPDLEKGGVRGGAYIGVGPEQNFSYIAHIRPRLRSSSTSAATICCCTCCSRRFSRRPGRESSISLCCWAARCLGSSTDGAKRRSPAW